MEDHRRRQALNSQAVSQPTQCAARHVACKVRNPTAAYQSQVGPNCDTPHEPLSPTVERVAGTLVISILPLLALNSRSGAAEWVGAALGGNGGQRLLALWR